nr:hypothetical protein [Tanacetum cinerariifolium]
MDELNITKEEYIQLMADKAHKHGQVFAWETAKYGKIYDNIELFNDFEANFPAIVYNDALVSDPEVSSEPTVSPHNAIKVDFDFTISFSESDDEDYTIIYDKNSSSYKLISVNDLKLDTDSDIYEINVKLPSEDISIKPLDSVINSISANDKAGFGHNGAKESKVSETITSVYKVETSNSETSNDKVEMPKIKTVRMSEPIIEEWESDSEDDEIVKNLSFKKLND